MARRTSEAAAFERLRRWNKPGGDGQVDMRLDVELDDGTGVTEIAISVGGRWDRQLEDFDGDAKSRVVVRPHAGQAPAIRWWKRWMDVHAGRRDNPPAFTDEDIDKVEDDLDEEVYSAMFAGGRRGGKTWVGALLCALYAVQFPGAIVWIVNPSAEKHQEVRRYMQALLAPEWIANQTVAGGWDLINGSCIHLKSGHTGADPDAIKEGEAHVVWLNEGQKMSHRVFVVARGAIVDHSGIVLVCANPPVEAKDEQWVADFAADAQAKRRAALYIHFNPLDNPHINRRALLSMRRELDSRTYRIEILGEFLPPADTVAWNWTRTKGGNERPAPVSGELGKRPARIAHAHWIDVTAEFLEMREEGEGLADIIGLDFQVFPHMGGPVLRVFLPHNVGKMTEDNVIIWGVDEVVIQGDEEAWADEALARGYNPQTTLIVGDGTGQYQHSRRRTTDSPPPKWTGRGSFDIIRGAGFPYIVSPDRRIRNNNPYVLDRVRAMTSLIEVNGVIRRFFLDPDRCPKTCKSIREWPTVNGKPSRSHEAAHLGDGTSYPIVRLFPRHLRPERTNEVDPVKERVDQPSSLTASTERLGPPPRRSKGRAL